MKAKELYNVGIYLRLSKETMSSERNIDAGTKGSRTVQYDINHVDSESNSISSQRELCRTFVRNQKDMEIYDIYVDDGYTGSNFDRPEFKRMMIDVNAGKVDCIVVKDLSRFGREYIEAGRFIQKTFPALNVRFVAITDHFDSLTADCNETSLILPVKNFINDSYCRDISIKVKSHLKIKRENGEFIGAFSVYGYQKEPGNKNKLIPDEYAAQIVRNIFAWRIDGMSTLAIAERLNGLGVLSPMEYKRSKGEKYTTYFQTKVKAQWSAVAVKRILVNEIYLGTLEQGKSEKSNYKVAKAKLKTKEEWIRIEGAHEPVVSREDFENVQKFLMSSSRASGGANKAHIFSGLLFCGNCNKPMLRRVNRYKGTESINFICSTRNKGEGCSQHGILEEELKKAVLSGLKNQVALFVNQAKVFTYLEELEINFEEIRQFEQEIARLIKEQERYILLRSSLYEDMKNDVITQDDYCRFRSIYEEKYEINQKAIQGHEEIIRSCFKYGVTSGINLKHFKEVQELTELTRDVLVTFISKILVYEDKRICVELKVKELFSKVVIHNACAYSIESGIGMKGLLTGKDAV